MAGDEAGRKIGESKGNKRSGKVDDKQNEGAKTRPDDGDNVRDGRAAGRSAAADDVRNGVSADDGVSYAWSHGKPYHGGFKCNYCGLGLKSGGVTRLKVHLARVKGDARPCAAVPARVRRAMLKSVSALRVKKRAKERRNRAVERDVLMRMTRGRAHEDMFDDEDDDFQRAIDASLLEYQYRERVEQRGGRYEHGGSSGGGALGDGKRMLKGFDSDLAHAKAPVQTRIDTIWSEKENKEMLALAWSKWFHARDIPGRKADCPYFVGAMKLTQKLGEGVPIPKGSIIDEKDDYNYKRFFDVLQKRLEMMPMDTHLVAAGLLDPAGDYDYNTSAQPKLVKQFSKSIRRISTSPQSTVEAIRQFDAYRNRRGIFGTVEARMAANSLTPTSWWMHYGADYPELQKYALRIVS
uniref:Uncharacterized protein n=1 Tax=Avena sativa TaxID=4498 RepID=A0ACD5YH14_AVESA